MFMCSPTGKTFRYMSSDVNEVDISDIATSLSNTCRFMGMCPTFYSVAEHSVLVSMLAEELGNGTGGFAGLMHDAHEAYFGDDCTPKKQFVDHHCNGQYTKLEQKIANKVRSYFGLNYEFPDHIKVADELALRFEIYSLFGDKAQNEFAYHVPPITRKEIQNSYVLSRFNKIGIGLVPAMARRLFVTQFKMYSTLDVE